MVVRGSAWEAASCTSRNGTPASRAAVINVSKRVGADRLDDAGPAGDTPDDASCAVAVEALAGLCREDRASGPFADGQVDGASGARRERDRDGLSALVNDGERPMSSFDTEGLDFCPNRLGHPQSVERQRREARQPRCGPGQ